jgi:hypothetical protein
VKPIRERATGAQQLIDERLALGMQLTGLARGGF